jgi:Putative peptidoglycan binding domain
MRSRRRTHLLALIASSSLLALVAGPLTGASAQTVGAPPSAPTTDSDSKPKNPFAGDGMWIWYLKRSSGGRVGQIAKRAHRYGIETVLIKSGDGTTYWKQFSAGLVSALHARGLNVCGWQFIYGRNPTAEARVGAAAQARGADCFVLDVEGQYEGKYVQASTYMNTLRSIVGPDFPLGLASFPYVDYHPALPFSVFLGPNGAQYNLPQLYWKAIGTTVDAGFIHTWVWNRIYQRPIDPLGQVYSRPKAGQIRRFRALALSHGFEGVSWWDWQEAGNRQWKAISAPIAPASTPPYPSYPFLRLGSKGDFVAWAQQLLAGAGYSVPINGYFQAPTQAVVFQFQAAQGLPATGNLDVPTWDVLLQSKPIAVTWTSGGAVAAAAGSQGAVALKPPRSANLPAVRDEIPPPRKRSHP